MKSKKTVSVIVAVILAVCCAAALSTFAFAAEGAADTSAVNNIIGSVALNAREYFSALGEAVLESVTHTDVDGDLGTSQEDMWEETTENLPVQANGTCGENLTWTLDDGVLTISGTGEMEDFWWYDESPWHSYRTSINTIVVEEGVKSIGEYAFADCSNLTSVDIPDGLTSIGDEAFYGCSSLTSIDMPDNVTSIGDRAFGGCSNLTSIDVPDRVTSIGSSAFGGCSSLVSVDIPDGVTSIGEYAFYGCSNLTNIDIPDGVTSIGEEAFRDCLSLTSIDIPDGVTIIGDYVFHGCSSLTSIDIPDDVTSIEYGVFSGCSSLTSIDIPDGVTSIGSSAFSGCSSLTTIDIPDRVTSIGSCAFSDCSSLTSIDIPDGVTSIGSYAFSGCSSLTSIDIPDGVTSIGNSAFSDCYRLTSIDIPDGVTGIGDRAFKDCSSLTSIDIPDDVTSIGEYAFYDCYRLKTISLPDTLGSIGMEAFYHCGSLESIEIPDGVSVIEKNTFDSCYKLKEVTLPADLETIMYMAFSDCRELENVVLPDGTKRVEGSAFSGCIKLQSFIIPDGVEHIGQGVFVGCENLLSLTYPESINAISGGFYGTALDKITILNENCKIYITNEESWDKEPALYGYEGSTAQEKADEIYCDFRLYCPHENTTDYDSSDSPCAIADNTCATKCDDCGEWLTGNGLVELHTDKNTDFVCDRCLSSIGTVVYSGSCGENVNYTVYDDGLTMVTGEGAITGLIGPRGVVQRTLVIDDGVTSVYEYAFSSSDFLRVYISGSVTSINQGAFHCCEELKQVHLSQGLETIGNDAFDECISLEKINIPDTVTDVGHSFSNCRKLTELVFPASVESIGYYALFGCDKLEKITVLNPECVIKHSNLDDTVIIGYENSTAQEYAEQEGLLFERYCDHKNTTEYEAVQATCDTPGNTEGIKCDDCGKWIEGSEVTVPHTDEDNDYVCEVCGNDARYVVAQGYCGDDGDLNNSNFYSDITRDVEWILYNDGTLKFNGQGLIYVGFYQHNYLLRPEWMYYTDITSVEIGDGITNIAPGLFKGCFSLETVSIPDSVTSIESSAFKGCSRLTSIDIPDGVTGIGEYAFYDCTSLTSIDIPDGVTSIDNYTFDECSSLTSIDIPDGVTSIGYSAFENCSSLTSIDIPDSVTSIGGSAFRGCSSLTSIVIPDGVTSIGYSAFENCSSLTSIVIPDSVTSIGYYAFENCSSLTSIVIPDGVTSIGYSAFENCSSLTSIDIPDGVTSIGYSAFEGCSRLKTITFNNPNCTVYDSEYVIPDHTVIRGYENSTAQAYAEKYGRKFEIIPTVCPHSNTTNHDAVAATCTTDGYTAGTYCEDCETWIDGHTVQTSPGHSYTTVIKKATTSKNGSITDTCENCGDVRSKKTIYKAEAFSLSTDEYTYNGKTKSPRVSVADSKGNALVEGTDFSVDYTTDRKSVGEHKVTVTLKGNYSGKKTLTFVILPKATSRIDIESKTKTLYIDWAKVTGADGYRVYVHKGSKQVLAKNVTDCDYTAKELETGTKYKVTVKAYFVVDGDKVYADKTLSVYTATKPSKVTLSSVTAGTKLAKLKWEETECTSYQIRYSTDKNFGSYETVTVKGEDSVSKTIKSLKSGKTYYFKVRAYKSVDGVKYYGSFSTVKSVKVK